MKNRIKSELEVELVEKINSFRILNSNISYLCKFFKINLIITKSKIRETKINQIKLISTGLVNLNAKTFRFDHCN